MHSRVLNEKSPFYVLLPDSTLFHLVPRVFGCVAFENVLHPTCEKFDNRSIPCAFLGYFPGKKGYKCMNPKDGLAYLYKDVTFVEHVPDFSNQGKPPSQSSFPKGEKCSDEGSRSQVVLSSENSSSIYPSSELRESHSLDGAPQFQPCELKTYQRQKKKGTVH
jgi:hypothetical protein